MPMLSHAQAHHCQHQVRANAQSCAGVGATSDPCQGSVMRGRGGNIRSVPKLSRAWAWGQHQIRANAQSCVGVGATSDPCQRSVMRGRGGDTRVIQRPARVVLGPLPRFPFLIGVVPPPVEVRHQRSFNALRPAQ